MPRDTEPGGAKVALTLLLWMVGFPALWPLSLARGAWRARRHRARMARIEEAGALMARAGEAKHALISTRSWTTMASGPDEEACIELTFDDGARVVPWTEALEARLTEQRVPITRAEVHEPGLALIFGWGLWLIMGLLLMTFATGATGYLVIGAMVLVGLVAFALS